MFLFSTERTRMSWPLRRINTLDHERSRIQEQLLTWTPRSQSLYLPAQEPPRGNPARSSAAAPQHEVSAHGNHRHEKPTSRSPSLAKQLGGASRSPGFSSSPKNTTMDGGRGTAKGSSFEKIPAPWKPRTEASPSLALRFRKPKGRKRDQHAAIRRRKERPASLRGEAKGGRWRKIEAGRTETGWSTPMRSSPFRLTVNPNRRFRMVRTRFPGNGEDLD